MLEAFETQQVERTDLSVAGNGGPSEPEPDADASE